jgi:hypothetical protein
MIIYAFIEIYKDYYFFFLLNKDPMIASADNMSILASCLIKLINIAWKNINENYWGWNLKLADIKYLHYKSLNCQDYLMFEHIICHSFIC